ncbi:hypothetical protein DT076_16600 [Desertihabitans brevis]|uniref:Uncharacterized protein n=1 Tax=Desertihabitans brevis TaxID=2268447 RepID=A0A367YR19_9ACTN|nr:hypothetical protein [Desertihabitans brevis]RCK68268.1 hypothetical protein DT076_16600 [Desertihabitans brevis]
MSRPEYVRVSVPGGHTTKPAVYARAHNLTVLKQPATNTAGDPLPDKPRQPKNTPTTSGEGSQASPATTISTADQAEEATS